MAAVEVLRHLEGCVSKLDAATMSPLANPLCQQLKTSLEANIALLKIIHELHKHFAFDGDSFLTDSIRSVHRNLKLHIPADPLNPGPLAVIPGRPQPFAFHRLGRDIVHQIAGFFTIDDFEACLAKVSREWRAACRPWVWKDVRVHLGNLKSTPEIRGIAAFERKLHGVAKDRHTIVHDNPKNPEELMVTFPVQMARCRDLALTGNLSKMDLDLISNSEFFQYLSTLHLFPIVRKPSDVDVCFVVIRAILQKCKNLETLSIHVLKEWQTGKPEVVVEHVKTAFKHDMQLLRNVKLSLECHGADEEKNWNLSKFCELFPSDKTIPVEYLDVETYMYKGITDGTPEALQVHFSPLFSFSCLRRLDIKLKSNHLLGALLKVVSKHTLSHLEIKHVSVDASFYLHSLYDLDRTLKVLSIGRVSGETMPNGTRHIAESISMEWCGTQPIHVLSYLIRGGVKEINIIKTGKNFKSSELNEFLEALPESTTLEKLAVTGTFSLREAGDITLERVCRVILNKYPSLTELDLPLERDNLAKLFKVVKNVKRFGISVPSCVRKRKRNPDESTGFPIPKMQAI